LKRLGTWRSYELSHTARSTAGSSEKTEKEQNRSSPQDQKLKRLGTWRSYELSHTARSTTGSSEKKNSGSRTSSVVIKHLELENHTRPKNKQRKNRIKARLRTRS